ncbi:MAG: rhodanese-like domain-containing protein [Hydrotalea sp.]|nr:rhodanese-like domain-containing protein [Hydrotalea sp.]
MTDGQQTPVKTISVTQLGDMLKHSDKPGDVFLLDVREAAEVATASMPHAHHISMNDITDRLAELPRDKTIYVFCHHGGRSQMVCQYLQREGFDCRNIVGGIHRYALEIDNTIPTY